MFPGVSPPPGRLNVHFLPFCSGWWDRGRGGYCTAQRLFGKLENDIENLRASFLEVFNSLLKINAILVSY